MFFAGLILWDSTRTREGVDPHLLLSKFSFASYLHKFVLRRPARRARARCLLFPGLDSASVLAINNSAPGTARVCAADDLELSLTGGGDQIEFFDGFAPAAPQSDRYYSGPDHYSVPMEAPSSESVWYRSDGSSGFLPSDSASAPLTQPGIHRPDMFQPDYKGLHYVQIQSQPLSYYQDAQPVPQHQLHFAMNSFGEQAHPFFTDFRRASGAEAQSLYGSSSDSFGSPLDEMFFKKPSPVGAADVVGFPTMSKKRKHKPASPYSEPAPFYGEVLYKEPEVGVSDAELPCTLKFEPAKKFKREPDAKDDDHKVYACKQCDAVFRVKLYLTRHLRKHYNAKAFVCPFYQESDEPDTAGVPGTKCHLTGGFSRRDTFKTHLKALHFIYPPGTKSSARGSTGGRCAGCFNFFESNVLWLKNHIESGDCKGAVMHKGAYIKQEMDE